MRKCTENLQKISKNIVVVLTDTDDIMGTVHIISIFYSYLFDFVAIFSNILTMFHG
jgi:hypothetical protein